MKVGWVVRYYMLTFAFPYTVFYELNYFVMVFVFEFHSNASFCPDYNTKWLVWVVTFLFQTVTITQMGMFLCFAEHICTVFPQNTESEFVGIRKFCFWDWGEDTPMRVIKRADVTV